MILSLYYIEYVFFGAVLLIDRVPFLLSGTKVFDWSDIDGSCLLSRIGEWNTTSLVIYIVYLCSFYFILMAPNVVENLKLLSLLQRLSLTPS